MSEEGTMQKPTIESRSSEQSLSYPALGAMIGGFVGLLGIFLGWFAFQAAAADGGDATVVVKGTEDLSGQLAAIGALVAFVGGGAMLLMADDAINRWATMAAGAGAIFLLVFSVVGLFRASAVLPPAVTGSAGEASSAFGVALSALGGVISTAAVMMTLVRDRAPGRPEERPVEPT
jgi:hypothetical protein